MFTPRDIYHDVRIVVSGRFQVNIRHETQKQHNSERNPNDVRCNVTATWAKNKSNRAIEYN